MIESNIIEWLDFSDSIQKIDIYSKPFHELYFKFFRTLLKNKLFPNIIHIVLIIISFIQILSISSIAIQAKNDIILEIFQYLSDVTLLFNIITTAKTFFLLFIFILVIILLDIILMIIILFTMKIFEITILIYIINFINTIIYYYLIGPAVEICLYSFWCENGRQKFFYVKCYSNSTHYKYAIIAVILLILYVLVSLFNAKYFNEIGSIATNINAKFIRINSNYEIFCILSKIFIFSFYFFYQVDKSYLIQLLHQSFIFFISIAMFFYVYKYIYYTNNIINYINFLGWFFISWFSFSVSFKILFNLNNVSIFIILGWILIIFLLYKNNTIKEFKLVSESNILEISDIKSIEMFKNNVLKILSNKNNIDSKILLYGIIKNFEEYINNNPEINYHYQKIINDIYLNRKYNKNDELPILSIIYVLYTVQLEKAQNKGEIVLYMAYFLINVLNNWNYAIYLLSIIKAENHMSLYYKYLLTEDIKDNLVTKLNKNSNKNSIKYIQIGSSILYYLYMDLFKLKIYEAICNQIDYLDKLKDYSDTNKNTENFLKNGKTIRKIRIQIKKIWGKLIILNPFSDESYQDYNLYLESLIQDELYSKEQEKKYLMNKKNKMDEKLNAYHSMFIINISSVILADGNNLNGKILYVSPNFPLIFTYNVKELLNLNIEDLLPNVIQSFHKELIDDAIKYSNINYIYKKQINSLLKNKNGGLFNIKLFVKSIPNLSYGLVYYIYLQKIIDSNFIIVLDKNLQINGFSQMLEGGSQFTTIGRYNLTHSLYGYHIGLIIPDILTLLEYKNGEFNISKQNLELKGYLYQINKIKDIKNIVDTILDKIKNSNNNTLKMNDRHAQIEDNFQNINDEFNLLIKELSKENTKPFSIFYKVQMYSFLDGKYKYYRLYINDDIITGNENDQIVKHREEIESKKTRGTNFINSEYNSSKKSDNKIKKIKKKINGKTFIMNENNNNEVSNIEENNDILNKKELAKKNGNNNNEEKIQNNNKNNNSSNLDFQLSDTYRRFNKVKSNIIDQKEIFPLRIMKYLCFIFVITTILFMIYYQKALESSFFNLSIFLDENIFFNMTKMTVAVLYITSINIKWQLHSCNLTSIYNMSWIYEEILNENIHYLGWIKNFTNNLGVKYQKILLEKHEIELNIYGTKYKENYRLDHNNILSFFVNSEINLLNDYPSLLKELNKNASNSISPLVFGINELNDLVELTYKFYINGVKGFKIEEKNEIVSELFRSLIIWPILNGIILIILLVLYIIYILNLNFVETFLVSKLMNFNSNNFDIYITQLDEIKKKLRNDNNEEEEKDDIDINDSRSRKTKKEKLDKIEYKSSKINTLNKENLLKSKDGKKQNKTIKQRKNKTKLMQKYFVKYNIFFIIKILIMFISLSYYILVIFLEKQKKNEFILFDTINNEMIGVLKECYDTFISLKRELELYEKNLTNCKIDPNKELYKMKIPPISGIKSSNIDNSIVQITSGSGYNSESLSNLNNLFKGDSCKFFSNTESDYNICTSFYNGILSMGIEQTLIKMLGVIGEITEELRSVNNNGKTFNEIIMSSSFITYELFIEFYYQKAYKLIDEIFWKLRNEKIDSIYRIFKIILLIYIILSVILFIFLLFFIFSSKQIFNSFINFIWIIPSKYFSEDNYFFEEIVRISNKYF